MVDLASNVLRGQNKALYHTWLATQWRVFLINFPLKKSLKQNKMLWKQLFHILNCDTNHSIGKWSDFQTFRKTMKEGLLGLWKTFCSNRNGDFFFILSFFFFAQSFSPSYWKYVYLRFPREEISWPTLEFKSVLKAHFSSVEILPRSFPINCAWCDNDLLEFFKKEKKRNCPYYLRKTSYYVHSKITTYNHPSLPKNNLFPFVQHGWKHKWVSV